MYIVQKITEPLYTLIPQNSKLVVILYIILIYIHIETIEML